MVDLSLPALLAGYVVAALVPAITIYVVLANLVEERLEETEKRLADRITKPSGTSGQTPSPSPDPVHLSQRPPSKVPPAPQLSIQESSEPPSEGRSEQG